MNARKKAVTPRAATKKRLGPAHVILLVITIVLGLVAATMTTLAVMRATEVRAVRSEAAQTRQEANDFYATHWCNRIAPTMRERIARHYKEYLRATPEQRSAVDATCRQRRDRLRHRAVQDLQEHRIQRLLLQPQRGQHRVRVHHRRGYRE